MGPILSLPVLKPAAAFLAMGVTMLVCHHWASTSIPKTTQFASAAELREFAVSRSFIFHSGNASGIVGRTFFLADHPITFEDLSAVSWRHDCGLTPSWTGILWVSQIQGQSGTLIADHVGGKTRVWGNVIAAGDEDLMDQIEELFRNQ